MAEFVSLHKLSQQNPEEHSVSWQASGRYTTSEDIALNVTAVERVAKWAGISATQIALKAGETGSFSANISGINGVNPDGSASAIGDAVQTRVETESSSVDPHDNPLYDRPPATVTINQAELASRVATHKQKSNKSYEELWAQQLDRSVRRGLGEVARKQLLEFSCDKWTRAFEALYAFYTSNIALNSLTGAFKQEPFISTGGLLILNTLLYASGLGVERYDGYKLQQRRHSLFPSRLQPDRWLAAQAVLASSSFVETRQSSSANE